MIATAFSKDINKGSRHVQKYGNGNTVNGSDGGNGDGRGLKD